MRELIEERYARELIRELGRIRKNPEDLIIGRVIHGAKVKYSDCCEISEVILDFDDGSRARITRYGLEIEENREGGDNNDSQSSPINNGS